MPSRLPSPSPPRGVFMLIAALLAGGLLLGAIGYGLPQALDQRRTVGAEPVATPLIERPTTLRLSMTSAPALPTIAPSAPASTGVDVAGVPPWVAASINCARAQRQASPYRMSADLSAMADAIWNTLATRPEATLDDVASAYPLRAAIELPSAGMHAPCDGIPPALAHLAAADAITEIGIVARRMPESGGYQGLSIIVIGR